MSPIYQAFPTAGEIGASRSYTSAFGTVAQRRETFPRDNIQSATAVPTAGAVFCRRITLVPGSYTTLSVWISTPATAGLANCYVGLYDSAGTNGAPSARLAVSSESASQVFFAGDGTSRIATLTLNYTVTAPGDYFIAYLLGSIGTGPTWGRGASGLVAVHALDPVIIARTNATNLTSLPDPIGTLVASTASFNNYWFRYE